MVDALGQEFTPILAMLLIVLHCLSSLGILYGLELRK